MLEKQAGVSTKLLAASLPSPLLLGRERQRAPGTPCCSRSFSMLPEVLWSTKGTLYPFISKLSSAMNVNQVSILMLATRVGIGAGGGSAWGWFWPQGGAGSCVAALSSAGAARAEASCAG